MSSNSQVDCLVCKKKIYIRKNPSTQRWEKFEDPEFKIIHSEQQKSGAFPARKPTFKQWASFTTEWLDPHSGLKRTAGLTVEFPAEHAAQDCFDKVQYEVLHFIARQVPKAEKGIQK